MRVLILGAGAVGGYFGGRMLEAGSDVTFLVRERRAQQLAEFGLPIESPHGNVSLPPPRTVLAHDLRETYDAVLVSCKAYDLAGAMDAIEPAVGPETIVVPLLNGMRHLDELDARFGEERVCGGSVFIVARLEDGRIVHSSDVARLVFGPRTESQRARMPELEAVLTGGHFDGKQMDAILDAMWEKWVFLATLAGITCLGRAGVGDIVQAGGQDLTEALLDECRAIAVTHGHTPRPSYMEMSHKRLTDPGSPMTASMLADLERGGPTEAEHILGDLLARQTTPPPSGLSLLRIATVMLRAQKLRAEREG